MAGLWQETTVDDRDVRSVTIPTTHPNDVVEPIRDRTPVVIPEATRNPGCTPAPTNAESSVDRTRATISTRVNDPGNDNLRVIEPVESEQSGLGDF